ncbi:nicotinamide riboside transporter PnuC [Aggregatibacter actinomycetemcomitans]|uniref:Nicotinamide riboside transporter PnuC n=1 Tax=Aggregatibacter actinomycetemcomitans TaxID=714 RepID=A0A142G0W9_AGGAC|nr:nicotinamide riboside transporter PnuC [Aggregatibacter actinomycetemcomitans]AFI87392.1 nicotinamide riboside transporter pnuC [Aggregatibacter actinomycetemcomitans D7S-1]KYK95033.1 nicotinamide riboside transporter pnuC [Aggregatibacter actinomycetemcomitans serotype d str. SA3733]AMQ94299.1 nicotinamide riboside transporter pnuC [Aggregatibacter actinomycetemcomitans]ANU81849.1 nicotinamide riboside transporter pnuC [Aggregatibacter actinomycetemcomitans]EKX98881.1 nicotinamide riboside
MNPEQLLQKAKQELFSGWKPFEVFWLLLFIAAQIIAFVLDPQSPLAMISGIAGVICVVFVSKGKISNYLFGLIFAYTYFYVAWKANFIGEMNTVLYVYLPAQFIGYFTWKAHMQQEKGGSESVIAKSLTLQGWIVLAATVSVGTLLFVQALKAAGGSSTGLDGLTTIITVAAQLLMILRYREQWLLWILLNIISILLWAETPAIYLMYSAYLLNSLYGYYNWTKLAKQG